MKFKIYKYFVIFAFVSLFVSGLYITTKKRAKNNIINENTQELFKACVDKARDFFANKKIDSSIFFYKKALEIYPNNFVVLFELGNAYFLLNDYKNAKKSYVKSYEQPQHPLTSLSNLARIYTEERNPRLAVDILKNVIDKVPNSHPQKNLLYENLSHSCLMIGDLSDGFKYYEGRINGEKELDLLSHIPSWNGEDIKNKWLVVVTEQSLGDIFQFVRYLKKVKELGGNTLVFLHKPFMEKYLKLCPYVDRVIPGKQKVFGADYKIRLMSLPRIFNTTLNNIPSKDNYLVADQDLVNAWNSKLKDNGKIKVGLCWKGNVYNNDIFDEYLTKVRSIPTELLALLGALKDKDVEFYCLQKENPAGAIIGNLVVHGFGKDFDKSRGSFMDTAAIMKNLDLVITIDTSIAHLAGGLGVPTWIMLPYRSEWRWLLDRNDSPWYSSVKLFRQRKDGDWIGVVNMVKNNLKLLLESKR